MHTNLTQPGPWPPGPQPPIAADTLEGPVGDLCDLTTDQLLEMLPNHLHLAHNSNANDGDRWRFWNIAQNMYTAVGYPSARCALLIVLTRLRHRRGVAEKDISAPG